MENLYPASPAPIPYEITKVPSAYKARAVIVIIAILSFMLLYLSLVVLSGYLVYWSIMYPLYNINKITILLKLGSIAGSAMLFAFIIKALFKSHKFSDSGHVQIFEEDHPELFDFIRKLCKDTKAPFPKKIFVSTDINAAVFYNSTILSLFFPVRKNLLIGAGLVNSISLSEFKAVLAHEFGHFSQSTMKLGSYVYMANRVMADMVFQRDKWDNLYQNWLRSDIRLSVFAWILMPVVWTIRQILFLGYKGINQLHASLSRQMEFNADLVAVSVTGSDAIINGLAKLDRAQKGLDLAFNNLVSAAETKLFSGNVFYHHLKAIEHLARHDHFAEEKKAGKPQDRVFDPDDERIPNMYASHPANYLREENAKRKYITGVQDERSPWVLFGKKEELCQDLSRVFYCDMLEMEGVQFKPAEEVQEFIAAEWEETTYNPRYQGIYENRFIAEEDLDTIEALPVVEVKLLMEELYGEKLAKRMAAHRARNSEADRVIEILQNEKAVKNFTHREKTYAAGDATLVLSDINKELEEDHKWFQTFDKEVLKLHVSLALNLDDKQQELKERYRFQYNIQNILRAVQVAQAKMQECMHEIGAAGELEEAEVTKYEYEFQRLEQSIRQILDDHREVKLLSLKNIREGEPLIEHLTAGEGFLSAHYPRRFDNNWLNGFFSLLFNMNKRLERLHFKSLGGILALQEQIAEAHLQKADQQPQ